ncbi:MAG: hypothetical protein IJI05_03660, partial [Erysipelotrichaceae bacterium]|nr:hypothetical protein [Erysipelotrichaceae bacterium]
MKQLIRFSLEKRFLSRISIIANIVMFVVLGLAVHADYFISPQSGIINTVYLDSSTADYQSFFMYMRHDEYQYHVSNKAIKNNCAVIHLNEQWEIHSLYPLRQEIVDLLRTDIRLAREQYYREHTDARTRMFIDEYLSQNVVNVIDGTIDEDDGNIWIVLSVVYFLIMTYGSMIAGEVMYEKATNTLPLIMASVEISDHFWAKVLTGYLSLFIQGFLFFIYALFWLLERTLLEDISELFSWISLMIPAQQDNMSISIPVFQLLLAIAIIMAGIVTMQILILTVTCSFRNSE